MNLQGLKPGAMLRHETYRIERMLGQGGFGITYLATDINLDKLVAIKEFFPKDYCDRESATSHVTLGTQSASEFVNKLKAKFLKEARNIAKFDHPGIIKIHAAFEENNTAYYVMDYIEGESLSEMVKRHGPLTESKAVEYIKKVCKALEYIHSKRINHLDIKPANIMVRHCDDNPILIDFGLSKQYDSEGNQTSTTPTGISHGYAPMEQYNDGGVREFSPQTDLYSLAATLYYILSGITPPQAITLIENEITFQSSIPAHLRGPITKAMSSKRCNRHESVSEFEQEISGVKVVDDPEKTIITSQYNNSNKHTKKSSLPKMILVAIISPIILIFIDGALNNSGESPTLDQEIAVDSVECPVIEDSAVVDVEDLVVEEVEVKNNRGISPKSNKEISKNPIIEDSAVVVEEVVVEEVVVDSAAVAY